MNLFEQTEKHRSAGGGGANLERALLILRYPVILILLTLGIQSAPGQTNRPPSYPSNRWLVVVQTTTSMAPRASAAANLAAMLAATGMGGQMQAGDTLGVWTFDQELHAGGFPLQWWTPNSRKAIADRIYDYIKAQRFEKEGHLSFALYDAQKVITNSDYITVVLITDGMEDIHGTPFDDKLNKIYQTWRKDEAKANIPFITVLRAEHGQLTNCAVTVSPWPLEMPPMPEGLLALRRPPVRPTVVTVTNAPVVLAPLIVSGKKRADQPAPAAEPQSSPTNPAALAPAPAPEIAPSTPAEPPPKPVALPVSTEVTPAGNPPTNAAAGVQTPTQPATNTPAAAAESNPPKPESASAPAAVSRSEPPAAVPATAPAIAAPARNPDSVSLADLLSRKNGWIIPLGIAGLVIASFTLGVVYSMFRRMRGTQRISLSAPTLVHEKPEKKVGPGNP